LAGTIALTSSRIDSSSTVAAGRAIRGSAVWEAKALKQGTLSQDRCAPGRRPESTPLTCVATAIGHGLDYYRKCPAAIRCAAGPMSGASRTDSDCTGRGRLRSFRQCRRRPAALNDISERMIVTVERLGSRYYRRGVVLAGAGSIGVPWVAC
jgi:hypothetical protein